jgi:hypothetical protein
MSHIVRNMAVRSVAGRGRGNGRGLRPAAPLAWGLVLGTLTAGCGSDFESQMTLSGYRVVGIEGAPPEVSLDESVELRVHESYDGDEAVEYEWTLCLYSVGAIDDYECASPDLEYALGTTAEIAVDLGPAGLDLRAVLADLPAFPTEDGVPRSLKDGYPVWIHLRSGPACRGCRTIDSVKRLTLSDRSASDRNHNPVIERFVASESAKRGSTLRLSVEVDAAESYVDSTGLSRREEYLYTWYTTEGKAKPTRTFGSDRASELQLPSERSTIEVLVAVRDERGGLAVARRTVNVE